MPITIPGLGKFLVSLFVRLARSCHTYGVAMSVRGISNVSFNKKTSADIEPPVWFQRAFAIRCNVRIGAFTYFQTGSLQGCESIGRYCSIAGNLRVGDIEHPTHWLSTNPFEYNVARFNCCLLYTSPSPRDRQKSR